MAAPSVWNSIVRLVTSDNDDALLHWGGLPFKDCRLTSDQGIPADTPSQVALSRCRAV